MNARRLGLDPEGRALSRPLIPRDDTEVVPPFRCARRSQCRLLNSIFGAGNLNQLLLLRLRFRLRLLEIHVRLVIGMLRALRLAQ